MHLGGSFHATYRNDSYRKKCALPVLGGGYRLKLSMKTRMYLRPGLIGMDTLFCDLVRKRKGTEGAQPEAIELKVVGSGRGAGKKGLQGWSLVICREENGGSAGERALR